MEREWFGQVEKGIGCGGNAALYQVAATTICRPFQDCEFGRPESHAVSSFSS